MHTSAFYAFESTPYCLSAEETTGAVMAHSCAHMNLNCLLLSKAV